MLIAKRAPWEGKKTMSNANMISNTVAGRYLE
jgi:hypothetical protein